MALSLSNTLLPFKSDSLFRSNQRFPVSILSLQNSQFCLSNSVDFASKTSAVRPRVLSSKTSESLTSIITELEKDRTNEEGSYNTTKSKQPERELADVWREIHGQDDWVGLLDPIDPLLRSELIRYGEIAQACYDAFDYDPFSKYCGSCRFMRRSFFESLGMKNHGYDVTRYLYATANIKLPNFFKQSRWPQMWSNKANWIGYVAVSNDEMSKRSGRRDITIAWRGTVTRLEWIADLMDFLRPINGDKLIPCPDPTVKVESGFLDLYTDKDEGCRFCKFSAREQILTEIKRLKEMYSDEEMSITITGHSLGSALAMLSAYDIAETGLHVMQDGRALPVSVFSFSGPRVGNLRFKERIESLGVKVLRVVNVHDIVPKSPGLFLNEQVPRMLMRLAEGLPWCYSHVGVELALDHKNSPFLKQTGDPVCSHNLEALLHLLDGFHGKGERFVLSTGRDPALVNKASDFLKDHYFVPPYWRQDENKGMVMSTDGRWVQPERPKIDDHPADTHHHLKQLGLVSSEDHKFHLRESTMG